MTKTIVKPYDNGKAFCICADYGQGRVITSYTLEIKKLTLSEFLSYADFEGLDAKQAEIQKQFLSAFAKNGTAWEVTGGNDYELFDSFRDAQDYCRSQSC